MGNRICFILLAVLFVGFTHVNVVAQTTIRTDIKGRLLTPDEGCGHSNITNTRIVGGTPAKIGAWPWIALLGYKSGWGKFMTTTFKSGGTLITSKHVLTAAHCILPSLSVVRLGEHDLTTIADGQHEDITVLDAEPHEDFNKKLMTNDIAIIYLERHVEFTDRISPICVPISSEMRNHDYIGTTPFIAGWGYQQEKTTIANVLQQVQVPVIENRECKNRYRKIGELRDKTQFSGKVLCAGYMEGGKDACQGDSGGPLMLPLYQNGKFPYYQIGVISYGAGCARPKIPGVYTNVQNYAHWIKIKLHEEKADENK